MKYEIQISPYGRASATINSLVDKGYIERRSVVPFPGRALTLQPASPLNLWVAFSPEVDSKFVMNFRHHSTVNTRLLILNKHQSSDTIVARLLNQNFSNSSFNPSKGKPMTLVREPSKAATMSSPCSWMAYAPALS